MRTAGRRLAACVAAWIASTMVGAGHANADERVRDASLVEASAFLGVGATALTIDLVAPGGDTPRWTGGILFDDAARDALSASSDGGRALAARASDVAVGLLVAYPFLDALALTASGRIDRHVAFELALTDLEAFSVSEALVVASKHAFGRQRPEAQEAACDGPNASSSSSACARADRNASFWSGHTAHAFTAAALACTEHLRLALYGAPWDTFACMGAFTAATTTGALRVMADRHWASDVVVGAVIGGLSGWLVPTWLRFRSPRVAAGGVAIVPTIAPVDGGAAIGFAAVGW